jgi:hypothetical protein
VEVVAVRRDDVIEGEYRLKGHGTDSRLNAEVRLSGEVQEGVPRPHLSYSVEAYSN